MQLVILFVLIFLPFISVCGADAQQAKKSVF